LEPYSPPPPAFAFGQRHRSSDAIPLIVTPEGRGIYDPFRSPIGSNAVSTNAGSTYSGYTGYESVSGAESTVEMEVLEGVPPESLAMKPVFGSEGSEDNRRSGARKGRENGGKTEE
jgi:hypothetical protein